MRQVLFLILFTFFLAFPVLDPAKAEDSDNASLYKVTDVNVDVTADTASHARDKAVIQGQRQAFEQLLSRLNADSKLAEKQNDDAIAALVQAFDVQQERTSAVHYIGVYTFHFKMNAVRNLLNKHGTTYTEARSKPVIVLPVVNVNGKAILWEENTKWRGAWEEAAKGSSTVPLLIPALSDSESANLASTINAISGKEEAIAALIKKHQASGAVVAILKADADRPSQNQPFDVTVVRYDIFGKPSEPSNLSQGNPADSNSMRSVMAQTVNQIRTDLEQGWKQTTKAPKGPVVHLIVTAPIESLAAWNALKTNLEKVAAISKTNVISLTRSSAKVELEFRGEPADLKAPLATEDLTLDEINGAWMLQSAIVRP